MSSTDQAANDMLRLCGSFCVRVFERDSVSKQTKLHFEFMLKHVAFVWYLLLVSFRGDKNQRKMEE